MRDEPTDASRVHPHNAGKWTVSVHETIPGNKARSIAMLKKIAALLVLAGFTALVTGCNTVEGFGQDVKASGRAIEKSADQAKPR